MNNRGFTLLELLVVIAIIGILSSIVVASLNESRAKARDARRFADFREFEKALELFYDSYGVYPCGNGNVAGPSGDTHDNSYSGPEFLESDNPAASNCDIGPARTFGIYTAGFYPIRNPSDPKEDNTTYFYQYRAHSSRQSYVLFATFENNPVRMANDGGMCNNRFEFGPGVGTMTPTSGPC